VFWTIDDESDERAAFPDPGNSLSAFRGRGLESFGCGGDVSAALAGEEVEVLGGEGGEVLGQQRGTSGEDEASAAGQGEEQSSDPDLKTCQTVRKGLITVVGGAHLRPVFHDGCPCGADVLWEHDVGPEVHQKCAVDLAQDIRGPALAEHDFIEAGTLVAVRELDLPARV
jgi:hypothetical protein